MGYSPKLAAAAFGPALLFAAAPAAPQGLPTPEERAFAAVEDARYAFDATSGAEPMLAAAQAVLDATESAYRAFASADRHRDAAGERLAGARWNCEVVESRDPVPVVASRNASWAGGTSTKCEAIGAYVETLGLVRVGAGHQLAERLRRFANRFRGVRTWEQNRAVLGPATAVCRACSALHSRATEAHFAANRAALVSLGRATRTIATAAERLTVQDYPDTRATEVLRAVQVANRAVSAATDPQVPRSNSRTDTALEALIEAARVTMTIVRSHLDEVERAVQQYEQARDLGGGVGPTDPGGGVVPAAGPDPADELVEDFSGWVRAIRAAVARVDRAAADAEAAAAGSGSWVSRLSACTHAAERAYRAVTRVQALTTGSARPAFVPFEAGSMAYDEVRGVLEAAGSVGGACQSIIEEQR